MTKKNTLNKKTTTMGIPTAKEALQQVRVAEKRLLRKEQEQSQMETENAAKRLKQILEKDVPLRLNNFAKELAEAIKAGKTSFDFHLNNSTEAEAIRPILEKKGYQVGQLQSARGESNMGDFNAPCIVEWERLWFTVTIPARAVLQ
jgi:predicted nuclease with TOPRIM domain